MNKRRILSAILIFLLSIIAIVCGVILISNVPNVATFTPKEATAMAGGVMLNLCGVVGLVCGIFVVIED